ncbi:MAG TPA: PAS domain S-box protein, partial [Chromatiales bacterium]|nr:PAS domain S-box protein [Chromatiales bacterium]
MSAEPLSRVRRHLLRVILAAFVLVPMAGIGAGVLFGITGSGRLRRALSDPAFVGFMVLVTIWVGVHFHRFFEPLADWLRRYPQGRTAPESLDRRLRRFYRHYWELLLAYALLLVPVYELAAYGGLPQGGVLAGLQLAALQVAAAVLVGLPAFLLALERLDSVVAVLGLHRVHISVRSKLMLVSGFVPLLSYAILFQYHTLTIGTPSGEDFAVWGGLALITILVAALLTRGMSRALAPVREMLRRSGASSYAELAAVRPRSSDEIGYMTQMLGSLFRRLGDQESHMRAVVDTAAEGIIVVDAHGRIDTFNGAAERLFGYRAQEARGRRLDTLLPGLVTGQGVPRASDAEQEVEGVHRNGAGSPMSVRVSRMVLSGAPMYTCLVADISKRKAAERERIAAEARYRDLVETAHDLVWSMDPEGRWTYLNAAARIIYGYSP